MAQPAGGSKRSPKIKGYIDLKGADPSHLKDLVIEQIDPSGKRQIVQQGSDGAIEIDPTIVGKGYTLELRAPEGGDPRQLSVDSLVDRLSVDERYVLGEAAWRPIFPRFECVTGHVSVCRPPWLSPFEPAAVQLARQLTSRPFADVLSDATPETFEIARPLASSTIGQLPYPWPVRCSTVCQGKVDVFIRTCCCRVGPPEPPIIIRDICEIIDCDPHFVPKWPPDPEGPIEFATSPSFGEALARRVESIATQEGAPDPEEFLRLAGHLDALRSMPLEAQRAYIVANPELYYWGCTCSTRQVATVYLNPDGRFDACFFAGYVSGGCTQRVLYRVSQVSTSGWRVVYDGVARNQSFGLGDDASLVASWLAQGCADEPGVDPSGQPFVLLESIGTTWASTLIHSTQQSGPDSFATAAHTQLAPTDGMANARPAVAPPITAGPYDQPWCSGLSLRFRFHQALAGAPFNATKYRLRTARLDDYGDVIPGSEAPLQSNTAWLKYAPAPGGGVMVQSVPLFTPDPGVYTIPFFDPVWPWLDGQFHAVFDTSSLTNGRYVVLVEVLRNNLTRLRPSSSLDAPGTDATVGFDMRRLDAPIVAGQVMSTSVVPHSTLANMFFVNNRPAEADITHIEFAGSASAQNCQFLTGRDCDTVALRYTARQVDGFQWYHELWYWEGLNGPRIPTVPPEAAEISSADVVFGSSVARRFDYMLHGESRCSFAANLAVYTRHTNGWGPRFTGYDRSDQAAFALETVGNTGCP
jgi:hypothetical protein